MIDVAELRSFQERFAAIRTLDKTDLVPRAEAIQLSIQDVGTGGCFEHLGCTYLIREKNHYEETSDDFNTKKGYFIFELVCLCIDTGDTVYFEWEYDDELEISITIDRFSFRNVKDEKGAPVDGDDLDQIARDKDAVVVDGETFWYEDDWASVFARNGREEKVYMYEFENEAGTKFLSIEEWQGAGKDEYRIYTSAPVPAGSLVIISKGEISA